MDSKAGFPALLRAFRVERGLSQQRLAEASGLSLSTVQSYEQGRRLPEARQVEQLRNGLKLDDASNEYLRRAAGLAARPNAFVATLKEGRGLADSVWDEVQATPWVCLILNERREIIAWNRLANRTGELDLGTLTPFQRGLLRMASTEHYDRHLKNWNQLIGRLISIFKAEGNDLSAGVSAQFIQTVIQHIIAEEHERFHQRIFSLFVSVEPWREEDRNVHPIQWRLDDGTELSFHGSFGEWNLYDGTWAFDWHAADARTAAWVEGQLATEGGESESPPPRRFRDAIASERQLARLSRAQVASASGISSASIAAYEAGSRTPSRAAVLALCRALNVDGYETNRFLRELGWEEEPSDFARWIAGEVPISIMRGHSELRAVGPGPVFRTCDGLAWPSAVLDAACHIVHANPAARRIFGLNRWAPLPGRPGPHLMQLMVSDHFLAQARNWDEVAAVILPGRLEPLVLGTAAQQPSSRGLREVAAQLRREAAAGIDRLADVWRSSPGYDSLRRPGVRFEWTADDGNELAFNCVISNWNSFDPYKALDLFPADAATFQWLADRELVRV